MPLLVILCTAWAGSVPEITIVDAGHKSFTLYVDGPHSSFVQVSLKDQDGLVLLSDRIRNEASFTRKYNLINLPDGAYTVWVEDGTKTVAQGLTLEGQELVVQEDRQLVLFAPAIKVNQEKLDFTLLCLDPAAVTIEISDEYGRENYVSTSQEQGSVQRRFDITKLDPGKYVILTRVEWGNVVKEYREVFTLGTEIAGN